MRSSKMLVTYWSTMHTLVVQQVLLKDGLFTGQLLLGHLLQRHSSSCNSDVALNQIYFGRTFPLVILTPCVTCYSLCVYNS